MSIFLLLLHLVTASARLGWDPDGLAAVPPAITAGSEADARLGSDPDGLPTVPPEPTSGSDADARLGWDPNG